MRRIVMFNHVTADGCFAGPDGSLDWLTHNEEYASGQVMLRYARAS